MRGLDDHYRTLLAEYQGQLDASAAQEDFTYELTPEDRAFFKSYRRNVALRSCGQTETDKNVCDFLEIMALDNYEPSKTMPEFIWNSIEEAWLMWQDGIKYSKGK